MGMQSFALALAVATLTLRGPAAEPPAGAAGELGGLWISEPLRFQLLTVDSAAGTADVSVGIATDKPTESLKAEFTVDPAATPASIDVTVSGDAPALRGTFRGIYEVDDHRLRLLFSRPGRPRPASIADAADAWQPLADGAPTEEGGDTRPVLIEFRRPANARLLGTWVIESARLRDQPLGGWRGREVVLRPFMVEPGGGWPAGESPDAAFPLRTSYEVGARFASFGNGAEHIDPAKQVTADGRLRTERGSAAGQYALTLRRPGLTGAGIGPAEAAAIRTALASLEDEGNPFRRDTPAALEDLDRTAAEAAKRQYRVDLAAAAEKVLATRRRARLGRRARAEYEAARVAARDLERAGPKPTAAPPAVRLSEVGGMPGRVDAVAPAEGAADVTAVNGGRFLAVTGPKECVLRPFRVEFAAGSFDASDPTASDMCGAAFWWLPEPVALSGVPTAGLAAGDATAIGGVFRKAGERPNETGVGEKAVVPILKLWRPDGD